MKKAGVLLITSFLYSCSLPSLRVGNYTVDSKAVKYMIGQIDEQQTNAILNIYDKNNDGTIDQNEARTMVRDVRKTLETVIKDKAESVTRYFSKED